MTKPLPISKRELAAIKASVGTAKARLLNQTTLFARMQKVLPLKKGQTRAQNLAQRALLWLEAGQNRDLNEPAYKTAILKAAKRNDHRFFIRLGRILTQKPYTLKSVMEAMPPKKIEWFLVSHWAEKRDGLPELFYLTPKGLTDVICNYHKCQMTEDAIVKIRQRLGLETFRRSKIEPELKNGKIVFPTLDKLPA